MSVGLLDIVGAEAPASVEVRGQQLGITGVSIGAIARALRSFPELGSFLSGEGDQLAVDLPGIVAKVPEAVGELIAAGLGHPEDRKYIEAADKLNASEQIDVLECILQQTFPNGIGPFVARLAEAFEAVSVDVQSTKGRGTSSAQSSKASTPPATASQTS